MARTLQSTVSCPQCCSGGNCQCSCLGSEWQNTAPDCPEGEELGIETATSGDCGYDCESRTCYKCVSVDPDCPCLCAGIGYTDSPIGECPEGERVETVTVSEETCGYPCYTRTCYKCVPDEPTESYCPCSCAGIDYSADPPNACLPNETIKTVTVSEETCGFPCYTRTCYKCAPTNTECCTAEGECTFLCPADVCDNDPGGQTPDGGPCCDDRCIDCGDCGDGGAQCCNSLAIGSLFSPLTDQSEELSLTQFVADLDSYQTPGLTDFVLQHKLGIQGDTVKFSVLYRAYLLDALAEISNGGEPYPTLVKHHRAWQVFANGTRAVRRLS